MKRILFENCIDVLWCDCWGECRIKYFLLLLNVMLICGFVLI